MSERILTHWVKCYADPLRGYLWSLVRHETSAEELLQEVFLRACRSQEQYREQGRERAYLFQIADRLARDYWRQKERDPLAADSWTFDLADPRQLDPLDETIRAEEAALLSAALDALSDAQRRTLLLRYFGDLSFSEISEILGCPTNTALSHARRGLARLREILTREPAHE